MISLREDITSRWHKKMEEVPEKKRRRVQRACDMCRSKRVKCERDQVSPACKGCILNQYECTYGPSAKPKSDKAYIESLENRLGRMEALMNKVAPEAVADLSNDLSVLESSPFVLKGDVKEKLLSPTPPIPGSQTPVDAADLDSSDDEFSARQTLEQSFKSASMSSSDSRFFGKSSTVMFLQKAMDIRQGYANGTPSSDTLSPVEIDHARERFWKTCYTPSEKPQFSFPPDDLMLSLIDLYFSRHNAYTPLLHRPTFEKSMKEGLHLWDNGFASVVLLVCAVGARHSNDPRVTVHGVHGTSPAGWPWFYQAQSVFHVVNFEPPCLYDLQIACLVSAFLFGTCFPHAAWPVVGIGLRMAQALGAHRRKTYDSGPTVDTELLKRAFWTLVGMDRGLSSAFGRPCGIQDEDFDVDLLIECDDEYWDGPDPEQNFKQPPGKPSKISFYNCCIRLNQIEGFALRTIYSINKSKATLGHIGPEWEKRTVAELDSALNSFVDSVPDHLKWNPLQENLLFLSQSALLYTQYYNLQITVHRPFIPSPRKPSRSSFPSLAICTNAARLCVHVLDIQYQRAKQEPEESEFRESLSPLGGLFNCVMVLLLNMWGAKRSGSTADHSREISDLHKAMRILKDAESQSFAAGQMWDVLHELINRDFPVRLELPVLNQKHDKLESGTSSVPQTEASSTEATAAFSNQTSSSAFSPEDNVYPDPNLSMPFTLPLHSRELGQLPLHPQSIPFSTIPSSPSVSSTAMFSFGTIQPSAQDRSYLPTRDQSSLGEITPSSMNGTSSSADHQYVSPSGALDDMDIFDPRKAYTNTVSNSLVDDDMLEMWSAAPAGFDWEDWGRYLTSFGTNLPDVRETE